MLVHSINPVFLEIGAVKIHYYGLIFAILFIASYFLGRWMFQKKGIDLKYLDTSFLLVVVGTIVGARLGHVFFYNWRYFSQHPLEILFIWNGGLASHGAAIGLTAAIYAIWRITRKPFFVISDIVCLCGSLAVFLVRIANFINGEIVGRVTDVPWGVVFPCNGLVRGQCGVEPRHPSQLYEAFVGLAVFLVLLLIIKAKPAYKSGLLTGIFLTVYFSVRFILEFFKEYDGDVFFFPLTNGHILSIPFILIGISILVMTQYRKPSQRA